MKIANHSAVKFINRVLSDYPMAREKLQPYVGKTVKVQVGVLPLVWRITPDGNVEMIGSGKRASGKNASNSLPGNGFADFADSDNVSADVSVDVSFTIPLTLMPRLARRDETAFSEIIFSGDSEFVSTLSTVARNVRWDVEEDLSRIMGGALGVAAGDTAAHRVVDTVKSLAAWQAQTKTRLTENVAEYLTEEKHAFITARELAALTNQNETLRDDVARLEARQKALNNAQVN